MNFLLQPVSEISSLAIKMGFFDFQTLCSFVNTLPDFPIADKADYRLVLTEEKGTNTDKHGLLALILEDHEVDSIHLMVGILLINVQQLQELDDFYVQFEQNNLPISLAYFRNNGIRQSFSGQKWDISTLEKFIVREQRCEPNQMINWKPMIYENYLMSWIKRNPMKQEDVKSLIAKR